MEENQVQIPDGWIEINQLGNLSKVYNGLSGKTKEDFGEGMPYIPYVNVFKNSKIDPTELDYVKIKSGERQNEVEYGDIIFTTSSETIEEVGMTSVFLERSGKYYLNSFCFILRLNDKDWLIPQYSQYLFRSESIRYLISLLGQGSTRYNLSKTRLLKELKLVIPSDTKEQTTIASILSKVDQTIAQIGQLIAKFTRIKTGLMQDLLTKGIDEHGNIRSEQTHEFKDSLLGRIPTEWEIVKVKDLGDWKGGKTPSKSNRKYWAGANNLWFSSKDIVSDLLSDSFHKISDAAISETNQTLFPAFRSLIFVFRSGILRHTFPVARSEKDFSINQDIKALIPYRKYQSEFLYYLFRSIEPIILSSFVKAGTTVESIDGRAFFDLTVGIPSEHEQKRVQSMLLQLDVKLENSKQQLSKFQSLKAGLMQDLLSGKVRVNHLIKETASV